MAAFFWNRARINRLSVAVIISVAGALALGWLQSKPTDLSAIRIGDFWQSYTAAVMVREGLGKKLYDYDLQYAVQSRCCPNAAGKFTPFPYPACDAVFLSPLAKFSFGCARWIMTAVMGLCLLSAVMLGTRYAPMLKTNYLATAAFFISCFPVLLGVLGAQNPALSMLLYSGAIFCLWRKTGRGDFLCGLCLGLWLFKPQYPLIILAFFAFARSWKILAGASVIGIIYYLIGAVVSGFSWPVTWLGIMPAHQEFCFKHLPNALISITGVIKALSVLAGNKNPGCHAADYIPSLLLFFYVASKFWAAGNLPEGPDKRFRLEKLLDLAGPAVLLIAPQPLYYDFGICLLPLAKYATWDNDRSRTFMILFAFAITLAAGLRQSLPVQPILLAVLGIFLYINRRLDTKAVRTL